MSENTIGEEERFRVVFLNEFATNAKVAEIRDRVATRFDLSPGASAHVFAGRPVVVKKNVDAQTAFELKIILDELGALSQIELMPEVDDTDGRGYIERRTEEQRKRTDRRGRMRHEHIAPDRRYIGRRDGSSPE